MTNELLSLSALVLAILIGSIRIDLNTGIFAIALAFIVGVYGEGLTVTQVAASFPSDLFLMLVGLTLFFSLAQQNGTLERIARVTVFAAKGNPALIPLAFFGLTFIFSALGPGNIAATALIAPIGMVVASQTGVSYFLMAVMIATGANAGAFSPVAPTGVISAGLLKQIGVTDESVPLTVFVATALLQSTSALAAYILVRLFGARSTRVGRAPKLEPIGKFEPAQIITIAAMALLALLVIVLNIPVGIGAFTLGALLALFRIANQERGLQSLPWGTILLISGVAVLIGTMGKTGGLDLVIDTFARFSLPQAINSQLAFLSGLVSIYSSSTGVVMPLFLSLLPGISTKTGSTDIISMAIAVNVGSHMVDVSPLSTLGALCLAAVPEVRDRPRLFRHLLLWGLAMALLGALLAFVFLDRL